MFGSRQTTVGRLHARTPDDPQVYRRSIERDLLRADVHPSWLPEESILYIRHVRLVNCLSLSASLKQHLETLETKALRPTRVRVPANANAIFFADEAERIACFAEDWLAGAAPLRWWWRQSFSQLELVGGAPPFWIAESRYAPAALHLLASRALAAPFVTRLSSPQRKALLKAVSEAFHLSFDLPAFGKAVEDNLPNVFRSALRTPVSEVADLSPESPGHDEQVVILHVMLTLARAPHAARSTSFRLELENWWNHAKQLSADALGEDQARVGAHVQGLATESEAVPPPERLDRPQVTFNLAVPAEEPLLFTHLGGIFYLVNLAIYLELFSDFTSPGPAAEQPSIWRFVEWLALAMLPEPPADHPDAIWDLLREWAGDDGNLPIPAAWDFIAIRARLSEALGSHELELGPFLLCCDARISITPSHVNVFFALAELQIAIRRSGLDRDPGWVPSAGRFIRFHYE